MQHLRLRLALGVLAVAAGIAAGVYVNYRNSFQLVFITIEPAAAVSVYKDASTSETPNYDTHSVPLYQLSTSQEVRLRRGVYDAVLTDPHHQYANPITQIVVTTGSSGVTVNQSYAPQKLADLLPAARTATLQALIAKYPNFSSFYSVGKDGLFGAGDWYAAVLMPTSANYDTLRVILHKQDGAWKVAVEPQITIGEPSHPNIPATVVDAVDNF